MSKLFSLIVSVKKCDGDFFYTEEKIVFRVVKSALFSMLSTKLYDAQSHLLFEIVLRNDPVKGRAKVISHRSNCFTLLVTLIRERNSKNVASTAVASTNLYCVSRILSKQGRCNGAAKTQRKRPRS